MVEFSAAIRLYFDKKSVAEYNNEKLKSIVQPVRKIQAKHSGHGALAAKSDEARGLDAVVFLSKNAEVMLTSNLWAEVGLCNGCRTSMFTNCSVGTFPWQHRTRIY